MPDRPYANAIGAGWLASFPAGATLALAPGLAVDCAKVSNLMSYMRFAPSHLSSVATSGIGKPATIRLDRTVGAVLTLCCCMPACWLRRDPCATCSASLCCYLCSSRVSLAQLLRRQFQLQELACNWWVSTDPTG